MSLCVLLLDLENIKQVMTEKFSKKLKAKGMAAAACSGANSYAKGKASGGSIEQIPIPKKAYSEKFCQCCKTHSGPHQRHNTSNCCCYDKDCKAADKPPDAKKPYKKVGGKKSMAFMQTISEAYTKAKKASKSKKRKKCENDSYSSSNSARKLDATTRDLS
jgi:hypothetical protein